MKKAIIWIISMLLLSITSAYAAAEMNLENVTDGKEVRWIITSDDATGYAKASFVGGEFMLHAEFEKLTTPVWDDFYEGWLVRKTPFAFISTGKLMLKDGKYINHYTSTTDYSDYTEYVLTIEPNDWDDAPADHIFEGMVMLHSGDMMKDSMMDDSMMKKGDMMKTKMTESKGVEIDITGQNFSYSETEIRVKKGDTVTINFESTDGFHDWVVDEFDAKTEKVSENETTSVTFIASKAGEFEYYCSVWNHKEQWMIGKLIVEDTQNSMMRTEDMAKKKMMTDRRAMIKAKIEQRVPNLSKAKIMIVLERVVKLREKLKTLDISDEKRATFNEVLDVFVEVLESDEMMMDK